MAGGTTLDLKAINKINHLKKKMQGTVYNLHYLCNIQWKCERKAERKIKYMKIKKCEVGMEESLGAVSYSF